MSRRLLVPLVVLLLLALGSGGALYARHAQHEHEREAACAGGAKGEAEAEREREEQEREREKGEGKAANGPLAGLYTGPRETEPPCGDVPGGHPESFGELAKANGSLLTKQVAPGTAIKPGAYRASVKGRAALPATNGDWSAYGGAPPQPSRTDYDTPAGSTSEGLGDIAGRATAFTRDGAGNIYVTASNGGIWKTTDDGASWSSVGD